VFPGFLEVLHLYGEKLEEYNENLAVYRQTIALQEGSSLDVQRIDTFGTVFLKVYLKQTDNRIQKCATTGNTL
jgi:hypothetical protein